MITTTIACPNCKHDLAVVSGEELRKTYEAIAQTQGQFGSVLNALANLEMAAADASKLSENLRGLSVSKELAKKEAPTQATYYDPSGPPPPPADRKHVGSIFFNFKGKKHKYCARCRKAFPATHAFFGSNIKGAGKLQSWCLTCQRAYWKLPRVRNAANLRKKESRGKKPTLATKFPVVAGKKLCATCNLWKPAKKEFYFRKSAEGRTYYRSLCKTCWAKYGGKVGNAAK